MFEPNNDKHKEIQKLMHQYYEVVFLDPSGQANLCHQMSKNLFKRVSILFEIKFNFKDNILLYFLVKIGSSSCYQINGFRVNN